MKFLFLVFAQLSFIFSAYAVEVCGLSGSVKERMSDCARLNRVTGQGNTYLVSKGDNRLDLEIKPGTVAYHSEAGLLFSENVTLAVSERYTRESTFTFEDALRVCSSKDFLKRVNGINGNWRLPTLEELYYIFKIDLTALTSSRNDLGMFITFKHWTSTIVPGIPNAIWTFEFPVVPPYAFADGGPKLLIQNKRAKEKLAMLCVMDYP